MKNKSNIKVIIFYLVLILGAIGVATYMMANIEPEKVTTSDVISQFENKNVEEFVVTDDNVLVLTLKDGKEIKYEIRDLYIFQDYLGDIIAQQHADGTLSDFDYIPVKVSWWMSFLPYIIIFVVFIIFWFYIVNQATGDKGGKINSFGKNRARLVNTDKNKVLFSDVAGADEEKEELSEVVEFLKAPEKYSALGARIPKGILLMGPPGTGKTLLAKAVAGEAGVPFYSISGSDFVEMYVGVGASRVRDLFDTAKKHAPCIVFIDEIDAVGRHRGAGLGGGHDEREQTLNQLLVEMDGFGSNDGVIVIAATNRPDILDPALLRPGRFDRQVTVNYPDIRGREEILKVHAKNKPLEENVDLGTIAKTTAGFTGADIANTLNEAALLAARKGKRLIGMQELEQAIIKIIVGPQKKSKIVADKEKNLTAYHEAGHAVVTHILETQDPVHQISIIPSGRAGGYTLSLPSIDKSYASKTEMFEEIVSLLGGRVSEKLNLSDISTGASNDIQRATEIARKMVTQYGMSEKLGPIVYGTGHEEIFLGRDINNTRNYSEKVAAEIDDEIASIIGKAYDTAEKILKEYQAKVDFTAKYLFSHETMDEDQFRCVMESEPTEEDLEAIAERKKEESRKENSKENESDSDDASLEN